MHNEHVQIYVQTAESFACQGRRLTEPLLE